MIVVNIVIEESNPGFKIQANLLKREDATDQEWKLAKMFEAVIEKATDTLAELNDVPKEKYKKRRID